MMPDESNHHRSDPFVEPDLHDENRLESRLREERRRLKSFDRVRPDFAEELKRELDQAFAQVARQQDSVEVSSRQARASRGRSVWGRLSFGFIAASIAVFVMILWPAPKAYSFLAMRQRLAEESFVQARFTGDSGFETAWMSRAGGFVAIESSHAVWMRHSGGSLVRFDRETEILQPVSDERAVSATVLRVMSALRGDQASKLRVLDESWREIEPESGADIELRVRMSDNVSPVIHVRFGIDSSTDLPVWMSVDSSPGTSAGGQIRLNYPGGGPQEIASLGVPASVMATTLVTKEPASADQQPAAGTAATDPATTVAVTMDKPVLPPVKAVTEQGLRLDPVAPLSPRPIPSAKQNVTASRRQWLMGERIDAPMSSVAMTQQIEARLGEVWSAAGVRQAKSADDYTMVRRAYLDLTGRIPRASEVRRAVALGSLPYDALIDELLRSPDFNTHMAAVWTNWLLPSDVDLDRFGGTAAFSDWLADEFSDEVSYAEIVRQLLLAEGRVSTSGPVLFTTALEMKPDHLAKQTARAFLGTRIDCAMCHDHPYDDWTQTDFWGYAALFARISRPSAKMETISSVLRVKDVGEGEVRMPDTEQVVPPRLLGGDVLHEAPGSKLRRKRLADWMTAPSNRQFARATVNRVWSHFFGAGLVEPYDDFGSHNPALSEPLLEELAQFFVESNYDLRELVRSIVSSSAYRQASRQDLASDSEGGNSRPIFDKMPVRWLTADALYDCLSVASGGLSGQSQPTMQGGLQRFGDTQRDAFIRKFGSSETSPLHYQSGIPQALAMMNGTVASSASSETQSRLVRGLAAPFFSDDDRIESIFLSIVGRPPNESERKAVTDLLVDHGTAPDERQKLLSDLVWALFNSAEFATNH